MRVADWVASEAKTLPEREREEKTARKEGRRRENTLGVLRRVSWPGRPVSKSTGSSRPLTLPSNRWPTAVRKRTGEKREAADGKKEAQSASALPTPLACGCVLTSHALASFYISAKGGGALGKKQGTARALTAVQREGGERSGGREANAVLK